jgi:hypothetical protein
MARPSKGTPSKSRKRRKSKPASQQPPPGPPPTPEQSQATERKDYGPDAGSADTMGQAVQKQFYLVSAEEMRGLSMEKIQQLHMDRLRQGDPQANKAGKEDELVAALTALTARMDARLPPAQAPKPAKSKPAQRPVGRPTPKALVIAEAERRLRNTDLEILERQGRANFLKGLSDWLPKDRKMKPKTIGDRLRENEVVRGLMPKSWKRGYRPGYSEIISD